MSWLAQPIWPADAIADEPRRRRAHAVGSSATTAVLGGRMRHRCCVLLDTYTTYHADRRLDGGEPTHSSSGHAGISSP
jgi:hypothetical protein